MDILQNCRGTQIQKYNHFFSGGGSKIKVKHHEDVRITRQEISAEKTKRKKRGREEEKKRRREEES